MMIVKPKRTYLVLHIRSSIFRQLKTTDFFLGKNEILVTYSGTSTLQVEQHYFRTALYLLTMQLETILKQNISFCGPLAAFITVAFFLLKMQAPSVYKHHFV